MKIAIFGGSFNPVHLGHTSLAQRVAATGVVDEVWLMPSPLNPLKSGAQDALLDYPTRLRLARLATAQMRQVHVSDFEGSLPRPSYTSRTLLDLRRTYPEHTFSLLIGEDNWRHFDRWYRSDLIRRTTPLLVYGRDLGGVTLFRPDGSSERLQGQFPLYPVSGTALREAFAQGNLDFCRRWLNGHVLRYIQRHNLYT